MSGHFLVWGQSRSVLRSTSSCASFSVSAAEKILCPAKYAKKSGRVSWQCRSANRVLLVLGLGKIFSLRHVLIPRLVTFLATHLLAACRHLEIICKNAAAATSSSAVQNVVTAAGKILDCAAKYAIKSSFWSPTTFVFAISSSAKILR